MTRVRIERIVDAPPEAVFGLYTDPDRLAEWQPGVKGIREQTGPLDEPGTSYVLDQSGPGLRIKVVRVEPPMLHEQREDLRWYGWLLTVHFEPLPDRRTHLQIDADFTARGRLGRLILPLAALAGRVYGAREFDRLKQVAERESHTASLQ